MKAALQVYLDRRKQIAGEEGEIKAVLVGTRRTDPHGGTLHSLLYFSSLALRTDERQHE